MGQAIDDTSRREGMLSGILATEFAPSPRRCVYTTTKGSTTSRQTRISVLPIERIEKNQVGRTVGYIPGLHKITGVPTV